MQILDRRQTKGIINRKCQLISRIAAVVGEEFKGEGIDNINKSNCSFALLSKHAV